MGYTPHVLVIGGGVVGTGVARDLAIRGLDVTLVEKGTLTTGATGRMQGVLYSGARQADSELVATQLARENETLREIASHCLDETGGLLVGPEDRLDDLLATCRDREIQAALLEGDALDERVPEADIDQALEVPDAVVDPFRLTVATARSAQSHGAEIRPHTELTDISVSDGTVETVTVRYDPPVESDPFEDTDGGGTPLADGGEPEDGDESGDEDSETDSSSENEPFPGQRGQAHVPGAKDPEPGPPDQVADTFEKLADDSADEDAETEIIEPDYVVNAAGAWVDAIAGLVDIDLPLAFEAGGMAVAEGRHVESVVTRYRDDVTDTLVPYGQNTVVGTTQHPADGPEDQPEREVDFGGRLAALGDVAPDIGSAGLLRAYWGIRCWPGPATNRHRFALVDHGRRDDTWGLTSVVGGSLSIHRLIAEKVADNVCEKFGISRPCQTASIPLPGSEDIEAAMEAFDIDSPFGTAGPDRLGSRASDVLATDGPDPVVCETQSVTRAEIQDAIGDETSVSGDLNEIRIRTSATMGACQGGPCGHRLATEVYDGEDTDAPLEALEDLLAERWRGQRHTLAGDQLAQAMENYVFHASTMNRKSPPIAVEDESDEAEPEETLSRFAGKPGADGQRERVPWGERPV